MNAERCHRDHPALRGEAIPREAFASRSCSALDPPSAVIKLRLRARQRKMRPSRTARPAKRGLAVVHFPPNGVQLGARLAIPGRFDVGATSVTQRTRNGREHGVIPSETAEER